MSEDERAELLEVIDGESARLARLVDDLLDLSKIQAGAVAPQEDWCDLRDAVVSAAAQLRTEHPIEFMLADELPLVRADAAQLERVFSNLIENAIKFSPPGVPVTISAGVGRGEGDNPGLGPRQGDPAPVPQPCVRAFLPDSRPARVPAPASGSRSAGASSRPTVAGLCFRRRAAAELRFAVSFPLQPQPQAVA